MSEFNPKQMQFVKPPRPTKHSRLDMFEQRVSQTESWFDAPIVQAVLLAIGVFIIVGGLALLFGWRP